MSSGTVFPSELLYGEILIYLSAKYIDMFSVTCKLAWHEVRKKLQVINIRDEVVSLQRLLEREPLTALKTIILRSEGILKAHRVLEELLNSNPNVDVLDLGDSSADAFTTLLRANNPALTLSIKNLRCQLARPLAALAGPPHVIDPQALQMCHLDMSGSRNGLLSVLRNIPPLPRLRELVLKGPTWERIDWADLRKSVATLVATTARVKLLGTPAMRALQLKLLNLKPSVSVDQELLYPGVTFCDEHMASLLPECDFSPTFWLSWKAPHLLESYMKQKNLDSLGSVSQSASQGLFAALQSRSPVSIESLYNLGLDTLSSFFAVRSSDSKKISVLWSLNHLLLLARDAEIVRSLLDVPSQMLKKAAASNLPKEGPSVLEHFTRHGSSFPPPALESILRPLCCSGSMFTSSGVFFIGSVNDARRPLLTLAPDLSVAKSLAKLGADPFMQTPTVNVWDTLTQNNFAECVLDADLDSDACLAAMFLCASADLFVLTKVLLNRLRIMRVGTVQLIMQKCLNPPNASHAQMSDLAALFADIFRFLPGSEQVRVVKNLSQQILLHVGEINWLHLECLKHILVISEVKSLFFLAEIDALHGQSRSLLTELLVKLARTDVGLVLLEKLSQLLMYPGLQSQWDALDINIFHDVVLLSLDPAQLPSILPFAARLVDLFIPMTVKSMKAAELLCASENAWQWANSLGLFHPMAVDQFMARRRPSLSREMSTGFYRLYQTRVYENPMATIQTIQDIDAVISLPARTD